MADATVMLDYGHSEDTHLDYLEEKCPPTLPELLEIMTIQRPGESGQDTDPGDDIAVARGMKAEQLNLYEGHPKCSCCINWVEEFPDDIQEKIEAAKGTEQFAILLRNRKCHKKGATRALELDSILVNSPLIKKILDEKVFRDYRGVTATLEKLEFSSPFAPFLHRWAAFQDAYYQEENEEAKSHLKLLYDAISKDIKDVLDSLKDMLSKDVITYDLLWTIFKPGDIIHVPKHESLYLLKSASYGQGSFNLQLEYVSWNGESFGYDERTLQIDSMEGTVPIQDLPMFPFQFANDPDSIKTTCKLRGQRFVELRGVHAKVLKRSGASEVEALGTKSIKPPRSRERVMIDAQTYYEHCVFEYKPSLRPLDRDSDDPRPVWDLTDDELLLCSRIVRGFSFKSKQWMAFAIDWIEDITWNDGIFENLVLPYDQKDLLLGFVQCHHGMEEDFDDFVEGKGRSLIFLLSGAPGVGKTLTAEGVAEKLHSPLYSISAGELGVDVDTVERKLQVALDVAKRWEAVLLLDEADIFLEQRTIHDLQRNRLVSVFLRQLEYYEGCLFLTTNRYQEIDRAFQSRIDMHLEYPDLDESSRLAIWKNFFAISKRKVEISETELQDLSKARMNGRQIKSVVKQAQLLAARSKSDTLYMEHVQRILRITKLDT
ncbi:unnamed protein product [Periconia digitata]|uniref:AAA+ ATPase domain-containing protein n=1 Tax=Periconia digitata TaxID=1303443 RepID=A0A9W4UD95_9PLEO|nr:unnamed protein product [Periconia digitata]